MPRALFVILVSVFLLPNALAQKFTEEILQQLGAQGYFYGPTNPEARLVVKKTSEGRFLVCLSEDKKVLSVYEVTSASFPNGQQSIVIRCYRGELIVSNN